jgi:integrase
MALETKSLIADWQESESIKQVFRQLKRKSKTKTVSRGSRVGYELWIPRLIEFTRMTPDELIAEGLKDSELAEDRLGDLYEAITTKKITYAHKISNNSVRTSIYGYLRGFYTKNKVNTTGWITPSLESPQVDTCDSQVPLFIKNKLTKKLDLNREILSKFFRFHNARNETIGLCLMSSGLDISNILALKIGDITSQSEQERIFITQNRSKTGEIAKSFLSREATGFIRKYILQSRKNALDDEPVFVMQPMDQKRKFLKENQRRAMIEDTLIAEPCKPVDISRAFRQVQESRMGLMVRDVKQSPLRPKRLRKVFKTACTRAGVDLDMIRVFMGQVSQVSKIYLGKSREELETFYEQVEPFVTLYHNEQQEEDSAILREENLELKKRLKRLEERVFDSTFQKI